MSKRSCPEELDEKDRLIAHLYQQLNSSYQPGFFGGYNYMDHPYPGGNENDYYDDYYGEDELEFPENSPQDSPTSEVEVNQEKEVW